ncbi:MAG: alkylated DNA repair dioxygenase AlkB [Thermoproteota archaeon]|jgi:alkylated DNA repair dioxygenase AlkB
MFDLLEKKNSKEVLIKKNGVLEYQSRFYPILKSNNLFNELSEAIPWRQDEIVLYGNKHNVPRLQAWANMQGMPYKYSGITITSMEWTQTLDNIKADIERETGYIFNSVLINLYRTGADYAAWHSDDEVELGNNPTIASLSLGAERVFQLKHKNDKSLDVIKLTLENGSLVLMKGELQHHWKHQLAKTVKHVDARINLTFRKI